MVEEASELDPAALGAFRDVFRGEVIAPGDPDYEAARVVWNGMIDRRPAIVVRPIDAADVISALRLAREQDLLLAVRSGGHSIPGHSTCDGGVVVDLSRMRGVQVDTERRIARVNGGALLAELDDAAQASGLACPVGVVSHTGVGGLTLGGGMGRMHRRFGLTADNLVSADVVTADGWLVHASEDEHADLFWGLRGAGPNFGIVTSFAFRLHPVGPMVTYGSVQFPEAQVRDAAARFREFAETSPDEVTASFGLELERSGDGPTGAAGRPVAWISALHCGSPDDAERDLAPIRSFGSPIMDTFEHSTYLATQHANDAAMAWGHRFYMKSGFTKTLPDEMVDRCVEQIHRAEDDSSISIWTWGRAVGRVPEEATAFTGPDAAFWVSAEAMWDEPDVDEQRMVWGRETMAAIEPFTTTGQYVNDVAESGSDDVVRSVYGDAKYERLVSLKRAWDPDNVFRLNQNVRP